MACEINIKQGVTNIPSGTGFYDFGTTDIGAPITVTFTIENLGDANLLLTGTPKILITIFDTSMFSVQTEPTSPILPLGNTTFNIRFSPFSNGVKTTTVSIANNDADENPYTFTLNGTGTTPTGPFNFDKNKLDLIDLEDPTPTPYPYTATQWGREFGENIDDYFSDGFCPLVYDDGTYRYYQTLPLSTNVSTIKTTLGNLYSNETLTITQWTTKLIDEITDWWETVIFTGEQVEIAYPHTISSWTGTVEASDAKSYLMIDLMNLYIASTSPTLPDFSINEQNIIDAAAKKCYLQFSSMLLI